MTARRVAELMTPDITMIEPDESVRAAATLMAEIDSKAIPVGQSGDLTGILTDRDIVIRLVARGLSPDETPVRSVMSSDVFTCGPDDDGSETAARMRAANIRRMPVLNAERRVIGLVDLADLEGRDGGRDDG